MKYSIVTFGCAANEADSERIAAYYQARAYQPATSIREADDVVINTCMIRQSAEDRVYGLVHNLSQEKKRGRDVKIVVTGCMVGMAVREKTGKMLALLKKKMPAVDEFLPIEEVGFDHAPIRTDSTHAWVPISNGCNNFCTFCVVPFTRGREISRPFEDILLECCALAHEGYKHITLVGQNVNSYGADILLGSQNVRAFRDIPDRNYFESAGISKIPAKQDLAPRDTYQNRTYARFPESGYFDSGNRSHARRECVSPNQKSNMHSKNQKGTKRGTSFGSSGKMIRPTYVKHLGRLRIPTLFPSLLREICMIDGLELVDFISSNPWDFSDELIDTIARNPKISRHIHLPVQSGDTQLLRKMNRWYTREEYLAVVKKIKKRIPGVTISTDIIVGFCGETTEQFEQTVDLAKKVGFTKAYVAMYSDRPMTAAHKAYRDGVSHDEKKRRWQMLEDLINKTNLQKGTYR